MTGSELARTSSTAIAQAEDDRNWNNLVRKATALAKAGKLVPAAIAGNPDAALAACIVLDGYGVSISPVTLKQLHFIDGVPEPSAQLQAGLLGAHGYSIDWIAIGADRCEARLICPDGTCTTSIEWTTAQARQAGLLDEWVERWIKYRDSEGRERNKLEKFVLGRPGVDTPDWVADLVRQGLTKRNENWHRFPDDMLASKVVRRLVKRFAAHITLGVDAFDSLRISSPAVTPQADPPQPTAAGEAPVSYTIPSDDAFERLPLDGITRDDVVRVVRNAELVDTDPSPDPRTTATAGPGEDPHSPGASFTSRPEVPVGPTAPGGATPSSAVRREAADEDQTEPALVDTGWIRTFAIHAREHADETCTHTADDILHAIARTVSKGRTASSRHLHQGVEADRATKWLAALSVGRAHLIPNPHGDGHLVATVPDPAGPDTDKAGW